MERPATAARGKPSSYCSTQTGFRGFFPFLAFENLAVVLKAYGGGDGIMCQKGDYLSSSAPLKKGKIATR